MQWQTVAAAKGEGQGRTRGLPMKYCRFYAEEIQDAAIVCVRTMPAIVVFALALIGAACGSGDQSTPPVAGAALKALDSARGTVKAASPGYFQRMLITEGADAQSTFGADLSMLGLDARRLQTMPVDDAYKAAHDAALLIEDIGMKRRLLVELFNETEQ